MLNVLCAAPKPSDMLQYNSSNVPWIVHNDAFEHRGLPVCNRPERISTIYAEAVLVYEPAAAGHRNECSTTARNMLNFGRRNNMQEDAQLQAAPLICDMVNRVQHPNQ